ncbi:MAG: hypothetical protein ACFFG0_51735 [Candidatus Thorarchaeota archaeon]
MPIKTASCCDVSTAFCPASNRFVSSKSFILLDMKPTIYMSFYTYRLTIMKSISTKAHIK